MRERVCVDEVYPSRQDVVVCGFCRVNGDCVFSIEKGCLPV